MTLERHLSLPFDGAWEFSTRELKNLEMYKGDLSTFDLERVNLNALLFQCGYLTITGETTRAGESFYTLDYPNREVRLSLNRQLLAVASGTSATEVLKQGETLTRLLTDNDFAGLQEELKALFAGMPYSWHDHNDMARYEGHYASVLYASFNALNLDIRAEDASVQGRADIVVIYQKQVFVFELKVAGGSDVEVKAEQALKQMRGRDYAGKYRTDGNRIHLLALVFDREKRNLRRSDHSPLEGESAGPGRQPAVAPVGDGEAVGSGASRPPTESAFGSASSTPPQGGSYFACDTLK